MLNLTTHQYTAAVRAAIAAHPHENDSIYMPTIDGYNELIETARQNAWHIGHVYMFDRFDNDMKNANMIVQNGDWWRVLRSNEKIADCATLAEALQY
jgi:hypothetical protein